LLLIFHVKKSKETSVTLYNFIWTSGLSRVWLRYNNLQTEI